MLNDSCSTKKNRIKGKRKSAGKLREFICFNYLSSTIIKSFLKENEQQITLAMQVFAQNKATYFYLNILQCH